MKQMLSAWTLTVASAVFAVLGIPGRAEQPTQQQFTEQAVSTSPPDGNTAAGTLATDPHLVGWWKFDETSGRSAADSSKHGRNGTLEGSLTFDSHSVAGKTGKALKLDGGAGCVQIAGFKGVTGTGPRTAAAWIKTHAASGEFASWGFADHGKMFTFGFVRGRAGLTPKGGYLYVKAATNDDAWHHLAVVVRQASPPNLHDDVALYLDGEVAVIHDIGLLDLWPIETGDKLDVSLGRGLKGLIDDLRIYDRALADEEIKALFELRDDRPLNHR